MIRIFGQARGEELIHLTEIDINDLILVKTLSIFSQDIEEIKFRWTPL